MTLLALACACVLRLNVEHKHFVTQSMPPLTPLPPPRLARGAPDEINMFCEAGHTQTAAITCLPKTFERGGGQHMSERTKPPDTHFHVLLYLLAGWCYDLCKL